ncbi:hypothetical protein K469DRAFT_693448 [Zopfia rhizophila CBS 207.26]|uniref:Uncharacterized protein n=1 Tax=Zopfia rhizophila CBS 207.26 TaxID=1314779 RepID=A0A6A6DLF5_9PEZI|nr:hypothetical protein K469DRAFT_693448 [Zopfia rhizophila CBS 207.26]
MLGNKVTVLFAIVASTLTPSVLGCLHIYGSGATGLGVSANLEAEDGGKITCSQDDMGDKGSVKCIDGYKLDYDWNEVSGDLPVTYCNPENCYDLKLHAECKILTVVEETFHALVGLAFGAGGGLRAEAKSYTQYSTILGISPLGIALATPGGRGGPVRIYSLKAPPFKLKHDSRFWIFEFKILCIGTTSKPQVRECRASRAIQQQWNQMLRVYSEYDEYGAIRVEWKFSSA